MTTRDVCWGCGASNPSLAADYQHFTAFYCNSQCREKYHLEAKKRTDDAEKKRGRLSKAKHSVKKNASKVGKTAVKDAKSAGKVAKVVAPLVILHQYSDSETSSSTMSSSDSDSGTL